MKENGYGDRGKESKQEGGIETTDSGKTNEQRGNAHKAVFMKQVRILAHGPIRKRYVKSYFLIISMYIL